MADPYDSDDLVFSDPPEPIKNQHTAEKSITRIITQAEGDRISSKKVVVQLQFAWGAPSTRYQQSLWKIRFEAYRIHTLKQDPETVFTANDMIRFFESMLPKIVVVDGKPGPNVGTIRKGIRVLIAYGLFK